MRVFGLKEGEGLFNPGMALCFRVTFEIAPAFTVIENHLFDCMLHLFGFQSGEGLFAPGKYLMAPRFFRPTEVYDYIGYLE